MQVIIADRKGPKINGYFTLATEIFDDSGAPHTLEHLVFMGSKNYQYKGLLDKLSSRAYSGTTIMRGPLLIIQPIPWSPPVGMASLVDPACLSRACNRAYSHR